MIRLGKPIENTCNTFSMGSLLDSNGHPKYGRPVILSLDKISQKYMIFSHQKNLREHGLFGRVGFFDDMTEEESMHYREAKQMCNVMRSHIYILINPKFDQMTAFPE